MISYESVALNWAKTNLKKHLILDFDYYACEALRTLSLYIKLVEERKLELVIMTYLLEIFWCILLYL